VKISPKTTYTQLWTGDFDKDGIPNIDDQRPFDRQSSRRVAKETSLSKAYHNLRIRRKEYKKEIKELSNIVGAKKGRVKTMYSAIGKQMGGNIGHVEDMGGVRILTSNKRQTVQEVNKIKKIFPMCSKKRRNDCIKEVDNKYTTLKDKSGVPYLGYHLNVKYRGKPYEIQIKCKNMQRIHDKMHPSYKALQQGRMSPEQITKKFRQPVLSLSKRGC